MADSLFSPALLRKANGARRSDTSDLRLAHAAAFHRSTLGVGAKCIAADCEISSPDTIYKMGNGDRTTYLAMACAVIDSVLARGQSEEAAFAEFRLALHRYGMEVTQRRRFSPMDSAQALANLSREMGELVACVIEAKRDGLKPEEWEPIQREAEGLRNAIDELLAAGQQEVDSNVRAIKRA